MSVFIESMLSNERLEQVRSVLTDCLNGLQQDRYEGYDPADLLSSEWRILKKAPALLLRVLTVVNVRSPVNLRPLLRIKRAKNTTALAVLGKTCVNWGQCSGGAQAIGQAKEIAEHLLGLAIMEGDALGWARTIPYQAKASLAHTSNSALTFINASAAEFFMDLFEATGEKKYIEVALKVCNFLMHHTMRIVRPCGTCLSYVSNIPQEIPNASIIAGTILNRFAMKSGNDKFLTLSLEILDYALHQQNINGSWDYSYHPTKGSKAQYDFHQVYMLDSIKQYRFGLSGERVDRIEKAFSLGMKFYCDKMFDKKMQPYWRYPRKYPIDIHNVSHAVYFFARYIKEIPDGIQKLQRLLSILLNDFYDHRRKYFYYQKFPMVTIKHNFFRWNTAWSLYALSELLRNVERGEGT